MQIKCIKCGTITEAAGIDFKVVHFGCPACKKIITYADNEEGAVVRELNYTDSDVIFTVGQKGILDGVEYTITGILVKKVQAVYYWREYILTASDNSKLYLSETDGHWIVLREVPELYDMQYYPRTLSHDDIRMSLYDYNDATLVSANGFFDYKLPKGQQEMIEYINPPYIFSIEREGGDEASFFGEHIARDTVKKAFGLKLLPSKTGVGIVQPFAVNLRYMVIAFCCFAVLILTSHLFIYQGRQSTKVVNETLTFSEFNGKDYVSKPFTLKGGSAPLTVSLSTDVDNSWASVQVALVNEKTNDEEYAGKDIEFYHGYEGGERWTEGDRSEEMNLCGVSAGTYHLIVTPQKPSEDLTNNSISISAEWNRPSVWNMVIPIVIMLGIAILCYYLGIYFEQRRWADSSYSPYEGDE